MLVDLVCFLSIASIQPTDFLFSVKVLAGGMLVLLIVFLISHLAAQKKLDHAKGNLLTE